MSADQLIVSPHHSSKGCCNGKSVTRQYTKKRTSIEDGLQWGSDPSFCFHGFSRPIGTWTEDRLVRNLLRDMACMFSGVDIDGNLDIKALNYPVNWLFDSRNPMILKPEQASSTKSRAVLSTIQSTIPSTLSFAPTTTVQRVNDENPPIKKQKCVQGPGQALCHCRSEKKRREAVGKGYHDLGEIVPGLANNNFTRKYVLDKTAKYVQELVLGNQKLRQELESLEQEEKDIGMLFKFAHD
ncbi:uncharacterized protein N7483_004793 [Penicillium malachiteum]|uniref:uncharacterized protein n=1 Tax=Penicillium malachiteum TaxID=1324776 RepID=UPI0025477CF9|nr:uncharacterized protein N7483_004793 [Penicillium malachiteum]KAJ5730285.1 hypothetical protein N7483_004793 [Penicillium malachiteum]